MLAKDYFRGFPDERVGGGEIITSAVPIMHTYMTSIPPQEDALLNTANGDEEEEIITRFRRRRSYNVHWLELALSETGCHPKSVPSQGVINARYAPRDAKSTRKSVSAGPSIDGNKAH